MGFGKICDQRILATSWNFSGSSVRLFVAIHPSDKITIYSTKWRNSRSYNFIYWSNATVYCSSHRRNQLHSRIRQGSEVRKPSSLVLFVLRIFIFTSLISAVDHFSIMRYMQYFRETEDMATLFTGYMMLIDESNIHLDNT